MKNERGEITLFSIMILVLVTGSLLLCSMELERSYSLLRRRTDLLLCTKETKEELNLFLIFMGRTNWALKNINRAKYVMMLIPGLQGAAVNTEKLRETIKRLQELRLISYLKTLARMKKKNCPIDPMMIKTPFERKLQFDRDAEGAAKLRSKKWKHFFLKAPYVFTIEVNAMALETIKPKISYQVTENGAISSSLSSYP